MNTFDVFNKLPLQIVKGKGSHVWDLHNHKYLDLYGGHAVISVGHSHPHYIATIKKQLEQVAFYSNSIEMPLQDTIAQKLGILSGLENYQFFLCNSGAEANENALKLASFHNGRKKTICFTGGFHGRTSLSVATTDNAYIKAPINETANVIQLPFNDCVALQNLFSEMGEQISSVIVEGIQGVGGIIPATPEFLSTIRNCCTQYGAIYIADAIQCGYGRTGQFFSHDIAGVKADIYTMAKGIANGFPVGALAITDFIKPSKGLLGTTFGGSYLACAATFAVLQIFEQESLVFRAKQTGEYLIGELSKMDKVVAVRGRGLMIGIELPKELSYIRTQLMEIDRILTGEAGPQIIRVLPALNLSFNDATFFLETLHTRLSQA
ncbi:aspartate aminotransferase family protein [Sphingobacterium psychroaquaticum]|uniref:Acetylornithine aminotransferase n=1 Tax=Sphingobacterium psychroaquaticum TaxID=561061 RepID=A0A1X7IY18_9SPHI|nr:aminotransferase class III-fold pyridoxal phosphate-dependent enzyme [Sphingobacterium psychroaquaticum]QBQ40304.1 aspartate aminotransferase family protein [Sphingobacterium psychroaquaticum]SMG20091.1 acetylornithine aminotransferase [Sphingobacterium psychroaquaticum]